MPPSSSQLPPGLLPPRGAGPLPASFLGRGLPRRAGGLALALVLLGCGGPPLVEWSLPVPDGERMAAQAASLSEPREPQRVTFQWRVKEADLRFQGRGLARIEPPYRIRIDLFTPQGETLFEAALVEGDLRIPPWAPKELAPPDALLWAALGVFHPDPELQLLGGRQEGDGSVILRYGSGEARELRFGMAADRLTRVELWRGGHLEEEVDLTLDPGSGAVVETVYRNRPEFVELTFTLETAESVDSFPESIWHPGR